MWLSRALRPLFELRPQDSASEVALVAVSKTP